VGGCNSHHDTWTVVTEAPKLTARRQSLVAKRRDEHKCIPHEYFQFQY
jgi:hypothetical protein